MTPRKEAKRIDKLFQEALSAVRGDSSTPVGNFVSTIKSVILDSEERGYDCAKAEAQELLWQAYARKCHIAGWDEEADLCQAIADHWRLPLWHRMLATWYIASLYRQLRELREHR